MENKVITNNPPTNDNKSKVYIAETELGIRVKIEWMNYKELKYCLENWYNVIKWDIHLSNKEIESLSEFKDIKYMIEGSFTCVNNKITSFEWFPVKCFTLDCRLNNIKSLIWIPKAWEYSLAWNDFSIFEEVVKGKLYKYGDIFFYSDTEYLISHEPARYTESTAKLQESLFKSILWIDPIDVNNNTPGWTEWFYNYRENLKSLLNFKIDVKWKYVEFKGRKFLKKLIDPEFHRNDWNLNDIEIISVWDDKVSIKGKIYNPKSSRLLK